MVNGTLRWLENILKIEMSKPCKENHVGIGHAFEKGISRGYTVAGRIKKEGASGKKRWRKRVDEEGVEEHKKKTDVRRRF